MVDYFQYPFKPLHPLEDLEYWARRWSDCYPHTYPPELSNGYTCVRCKERIMTGHQCKDIYDYIVESRLNE